MDRAERLRKARERFAATVRREEHAIDLATATLMIAEEAYDRVDIGASLATLDRIADNARDAVWGAGHGDDQVRALAEHLTDLEQFRGNDEDYYDPRNSYLNEVLERRLAIPITLAIVYITVGRRLGVRIEGVGFPGHFLVRGPGGALFDPFHGGQELDAEDLQLLASSFGLGPLRPDFLQAVTKKQLLFRVLQNLRVIYEGQQSPENREDRADPTLAFGCVHRQLALMPELPELYRDRGILHYRSGRPGRAAADLERYAALQPKAGDANDALELAAKLKAHLLN